MTNVIDFKEAQLKHNPDFFKVICIDETEDMLIENCLGSQEIINYAEWADIYVFRNKFQDNPFYPPDDIDWDDYYSEHPEQIEKAKAWNSERILKYSPIDNPYCPIFTDFELVG